MQSRDFNTGLGAASLVYTHLPRSGFATLLKMQEVVKRRVSLWTLMSEHWFDHLFLYTASMKLIFIGTKPFQSTMWKLVQLTSQKWKRTKLWCSQLNTDLSCYSSELLLWTGTVRMFYHYLFRCSLFLCLLSLSIFLRRQIICLDKDLCSFYNWLLLWIVVDYTLESTYNLAQAAVHWKSTCWATGLQLNLGLRSPDEE